ncbi:hypothetical protein Tco_1394704 [Tanacetum coccineum]
MFLTRRFSLSVREYRIGAWPEGLTMPFRAKVDRFSLGKYVITSDVSHERRMVLEDFVFLRISIKSPRMRLIILVPDSSFDGVGAERMGTSVAGSFVAFPCTSLEPNNPFRLLCCTVPVLARDYSCVSSSYSRLRCPSSTMTKVKNPKVAPCMSAQSFHFGQVLDLVIELAGWSCPREVVSHQSVYGEDGRVGSKKYLFRVVAHLVTLVYPQTFMRLAGVVPQVTMYTTYYTERGSHKSTFSFTDASTALSAFVFKVLMVFGPEGVPLELGGARASWRLSLVALGPDGVGASWHLSLRALGPDIELWYGFGLVAVSGLCGGWSVTLTRMSGWGCCFVRFASWVHTPETRLRRLHALCQAYSCRVSSVFGSCSLRACLSDVSGNFFGEPISFSVRSVLCGVEFSSLHDEERVSGYRLKARVLSETHVFSETRGGGCESRGRLIDQDGSHGRHLREETNEGHVEFPPWLCYVHGLVHEPLRVLGHIKQHYLIVESGSDMYPLLRYRLG